MRKWELKSCQLSMEFQQTRVSKDSPHTPPIPKPPNPKNPILRMKPKVEKPAILLADHHQEFTQMFERGLKRSNLTMEQIRVSKDYPYKPIPKPPNQENLKSRKKPNVEKPAILLSDHHQKFAQMFKRGLKSSNLTMKQIGVSKDYPYKPISKPPNQENPKKRKKPNVEKPAILLADHHQEFAQTFKRGLKSSNLTMKQIGVSKGYPYKPIPKPPNHENPISRKKPKVEKPTSLLTDHHQEFAQMFKRGLKRSNLAIEQIGVSRGYPYRPIPKPPNQENPMSRKKPEVGKPASLLADHHQEFAQMVRRGLKSSNLPMEQIGVSKGYPYKPIPKPPNQESPISRKKPNVEKPAINRFGNSETEKGQSSKSNNHPKFICEICVEPKTANDSFSIQGCIHAYCTDCMAKYVASKLQENITNIRCPVSGCGGLLEPEYCRSILPLEVFHRWGNALCEALILGSQKFYCPFKDCSAMLINDGGEVIRESECPYCRRLFCAHCKVPWHSGIGCNRFQTLHKDERDEDDIMLMKLAENKLWKRCPKCRIYVERTQGCKFMKCRCGTHFCYGCGTANISSQSHYCNYCRG